MPESPEYIATTRRAETIRETTGCSWESACARAELECDLASPTVACRHCGEEGPCHLADEDGTCPRCALRMAYEGAGVLAENGEAVDAFIVLENAVGAFLADRSAPAIHNAAFIR